MTTRSIRDSHFINKHSGWRWKLLCLLMTQLQTCWGNCNYKRVCELDKVKSYKRRVFFGGGGLKWGQHKTVQRPRRSGQDHDWHLVEVISMLKWLLPAAVLLLAVLTCFHGGCLTDKTNNKQTHTERLTDRQTDRQTRQRWSQRWHHNLCV